MGEYRIINVERVPFLASELGISASSSMPIDWYNHVGKWRVNFNSSGYGMAHRLAFKREVEDKENGDKYFLVAHFAVPIARKDVRVTLDEIERMYMHLAELMEETGIIIAERFCNVSCVFQGTPEPMKRELEEILSRIEV